MNLEELEAELLRLDLRTRATLAETLLSSLDAPSEAELDAMWAAEAQRRDEELDAGTAMARPAGDVFREIS